MKIVFDLDGVLRNLNAALNTSYGVPFPKDWHWKHDGKDVFEWVAKDYDILRTAPETDYCKIVKTYMKELEIWTCQPKAWVSYTMEWIYNHIGTCNVRILTNEQKQERLTFLIDTILVEDSPCFTTYNRIILINTPYNQHIHTTHRIETPEELAKLCKMHSTEQTLCEKV